MSVPTPKKATMFVANSYTGDVAKVNSSAMLAGMQGASQYVEAIRRHEESVLKAAQTKKGAVSSAKLHERYGITLDGVLCAYRPIDLYLFAYALSLNTYHARCCKVKKQDITQRPWKLIGETKGTKKDEIQEFLETAFGQKSFEEGFGNAWLDYEGIGNGYIEVVPRADSSGIPAALNHVPATEVWIRLDGLGFVQQKNGLFSHFKVHGLPAEDYAELNPNDPVLKAETSLASIHEYVSWSEFYGIPCIMPAWSRMALSVLEAEHNLAFFNNGAIPDYAVMCEGDWEDDIEDKIRDYFKNHLKGKAHKTAVFRLPSGAKLTFQQLTSKTAREGEFRLLRQDCRDEIIQAHGMPPQKIGIVEHGKLGGSSGDEQIEEYKNSIVTPGQQKFGNMINSIIKPFGTDLKFHAEPYDTEDRKANAAVDAIYLQNQVRTPNEVRIERFPDDIPLPGGDKVLPIAGAKPEGNDGLAAVQNMLRKYIARGGK